MAFLTAIIRSGAMVVCLSLVHPVLAGDCVPDPQQWYKDSYAPLWAGNTGEKLDQVVNHYADTIINHPLEGDPVVENSREWLAGAIQSWQDEGWLDSELDGFDMDRINPSTVLFKTRWHDRYEGGVKSHECGWYQADLIDGQWKFTQYATIDCTAHGLD